MTLDAFFSLVPAALAVVDLDGRVLTANAAFELASGLSRQQLESRCILDFVYPEDLGVASAAFAEVVERGKADGVEFRITSADGGCRWVLASAARAPGENLIYIAAKDITQQKADEKQARTSEAWLKATLSAAGVGICYQECGHTRATDQQFRLYGLEPSDTCISREDWLLLIHPEDRQRIDDEQHRAVESRRPYELQFRVVWPDRSVHWLLCRGQVFSGPAGDRKIEVTVDITGQKQAEAALERFFTLCPVPLLISTFDGRILRANPALLKLSGYTLEELHQRPVMEFFHPDDHAAMRAEVKKNIAAGRGDGMEIRGIRKDGSICRILTSVAVVREERLIYSASYDITARKSAEQTQKETERLLNLIVQNIDEAFWMADFKLSKILYASPAYERIWGRPLKELLENPRSLIDSVHPDDRHEVLEHFEPGNLGRPFSHEYRIVRPDGSIAWILDRGFPIEDPEGQGSVYVGVALDITKRKRAQGALEEFFALSQAPLGIFGYDGYLKEFNDAVPRISGFTREELLGRRAVELFHPDDRATMRHQMRKLIASGGSAEFECRGSCKDGSIVWFLLSAAASPDEKRIYAVAHDITARKKAEAAFAEEAFRRRTLFEQSRDGIVVIGNDGKVREANEALARLLGYTREELLQSHIWDWDVRFSQEQLVRMLHASDTPPIFESVQRRKDGGFIDVEIGNTTVEVNGEVLHYGLIRDITARKRGQQAMFFLRTLIDLSPDLIYAKDTQGRFTVANESVARLMGASTPDSLLGKTDFDYYPKDLAGRYFADEQEVVQAGKPIISREEPCVDRAGNSIWFSTTKVPIRDASGKITGIVGVGRDITEHKRMADMLALQAEKLAQSNAELEHFAYIASHDLQEPLRMVASFMQLLSTKYSGKLDETADRYIHFAVDGAHRMQQMITALLSYSRVGKKELDIRSTDCAEVVQQCQMSLSAAIEEAGASVETGPLPSIMADPIQIGQLFQNLIGNAIKFRGKAAPKVQIGAADQGASWLFSVRDNGIGIDPRHADRIFQIFQRLHGKQEYPGSGIGLAVCKKVVERHGGRMWVESQPGEGSTFYFTLPKTQSRGAP